MDPIAARRELYKRDFELFAAEQLKISTPNPGELVPLRFNEPQRMLLAKLKKQREEIGYIRYCCCKSRQSTMSTFAQALCYWATVSTPHFNSLLIANDDKSTADIFGITQRFHTHVGRDYRPMTKNSNKQEFVFANPDQRRRHEDPGLESVMQFQSAKTITAGTGSTRHACHLSELSKWDEDWVELLFSSILPALHLKPGTIGIKESTPYIGGAPFREMCEDARAGRSLDVWHFIPWWFDEKNTAPLKAGEKLRLDQEERAIQRLAKRGQKQDDVPPFEMAPEQFKWRRLKIIDLKSETMFSQEYPCVREGIRVGTQRGLIPIEAVQPGDRTACGVVTATRPAGTQALFRAVTRDGYSVTGTADHPLVLAAGADLFGNATSIALRSALGKVVGLGQPRFADSYHEAVWWDGCLRQSVLIDEDFGRFLGYFMGDGSLHSVSCGPTGHTGSATVSIACDRQDEDVVADVQRLMRKIVGEPSTVIVGTKRGGVDVRKGSATFLRVAQGLGIYKGPAKPHRKVCVPECIWRSPQSVVREFLMGLFEADGSKRAMRAVLLFSKYRDFLEDVQLLLLGFGIHCRLSTSNRRNHLGPYVANELTLRAEETDAFGERLGFISARKRERFKAPARRAQSRRRWGGRPASWMTMTDTVVAVHDLGESAPVYDLTVEETHQFDANGIRVHNCDFESGWLRQDAEVFDRLILDTMKRDLRPPRRFVTIEPGPQVKTLRRGDGLHNVLSDVDYCAIWEEPIKGVQYDIGADVSVGSREANDWSTGQVLRRDTREQVAEIHLHIDPKDFGTLLYWLGKFYNTAQLVVEMNGPGFATHGQIASMAYPYIYTWRHRERDVPTFSTYKGWKTQHDSKQLMVSNAVHRFNHREITVRSQVLWDEMKAYAQISPGTFRAANGHDDAVTAWMIGIQGGEDESFGLDAQTAQSQEAVRPAEPRDVSVSEPGFGRPTTRSGDVDEIMRELEGV